MTDDEWMDLAMIEATRGVGLTSPNPAVGAVIVKEDKLLGKGWHQKAGQPHAERNAMAEAAEKHSYEAMKGATIYVTLEPCSTAGRTPACTDGIIEAGMSRVVYGAVDPNKFHAGNADRVLEEKGIQVTRLLRDDCEYIIRGFSKVQRTGLPWVIIKSGMSLDGKITRPEGEGQWLTSEESRALVQKMRHSADAIITSGETLRRDNPALTIRDESLASKPQPMRMVITRGKKEQLSDQFTLFTDKHSERTIVQEDGDLEVGLKKLVQMGCNTVMVEAGGRLTKAFFDAQLVDEIAFFYAPLIIGTDKTAVNALRDSVKLKNLEYQKVGSDVLLSGVVNYDS